MLLRNKDKEALLNIFSSAMTPMEVWAYGSRVTGTAHEGSDLDLVIRAQNLRKFPHEALMKIKEKIRESNIPIIVEVFDWTRLPESFHRNIEANHLVLYSNFEIFVNEAPPEYNQKKEEKE